MTQFDSTKSESSVGHTAQHAMLTSEQTNGAMPRRVFIHQDGRARNWDIDRLGFNNLWLFVYESPVDYWHPNHDRMDVVDGDRSPTISPKASIGTTFEDLSVQDPRNQELSLTPTEQDHRENKVYEFDNFDPRPIVLSLGGQEGTGYVAKSVPGSPRVSPRRTRRGTRLDPYVYPSPALCTDEEDDAGSGPPPDPKHVPHDHDETDVSRPNLRSATPRPKRSTSTPRSSKPRAPKNCSGTTSKHGLRNNKKDATADFNA